MSFCQKKRLEFPIQSATPTATRHREIAHDAVVHVREVEAFEVDAEAVVVAYVKFVACREAMVEIALYAILSIVLIHSIAVSAPYERIIERKPRSFYPCIART